VKTGKTWFSLSALADQAAAEQAVQEMCEKLLVNKVMEEYTFELREVAEWRFGVVVFPGSDAADCYYVIDQVLGHSVSYIWHQDKDLTDFDCVILPGGFSYGDYLRAGSVAAVAPVMDGIVKYADSGGLKSYGIGNGFQVLLEAGFACWSDAP